MSREWRLSGIFFLKSNLIFVFHCEETTTTTTHSTCHGPHGSSPALFFLRKQNIKIGSYCSCNLLFIQLLQRLCSLSNLWHPPGAHREPCYTSLSVVFFPLGRIVLFLSWFRGQQTSRIIPSLKPWCCRSTGGGEMLCVPFPNTTRWSCLL